MTHAWNNSGTTVTDTYDYVNDGRGLRVEVSKNGIVQKRFIYDESGRLVAEQPGNGRLPMTGFEPPRQIRMIPY